MSDAKPKGGKFEFKAWYAEHREEISRARRERYVNDPEYRAKVAERNRAARERARSEREQQIKPEWRTVSVGGVEYFSIGAAAQALGVSFRTLRAWERLGRIQSPRRGGKGDRLYSASEILALRDQVVREGWLDLEAPRRADKPLGRRVLLRRSDGVEIESCVYRVQALAQALGVRVSTLDQMWAGGRLPPPLRIPESGHRVCTMEMIRAASTEYHRMKAAAVRPSPVQWAAYVDSVRSLWAASGCAEAATILKVVASGPAACSEEEGT